MESISYHRGLVLSPSKGFTLVELMVVLAIIGVVLSIVITSQSTFNSTLTLQNSAYDIALTLRTAETYGLGSRVSGATANSGYGVHFQKGTPGSFILFADTIPLPDDSNCHGLPAGGANAPDAQPGNCKYDDGELVQTYTLGNGITISDFCAFNGSWSCAYAQSGRLTSLDIVFARPNPDAFIRANGSSSVYTSAYLSVTSPNGGTYSVSVASSGQISTYRVASACIPPWGGSIASGSSVTAYQVSSVTLPAHCSSVSQTRACSNGFLSGSYTNENCTENNPSCSANGATCNGNGNCCSLNCYIDADGDRYAPASGTKTCRANSQLSGTDCNDGNVAIYPTTSGGSTCSYCNTNGTITYQTSAQDLFGQCSVTGSGCTSTTGNCSGTGYSCNTVQPIDSQPAGCNSSSQYCDGAGNCKTMKLNKISAASCYNPGSYPTTFMCKPSTVNAYGTADQCTTNWIANHFTLTCTDNLHNASWPLYSDNWVPGSCPGYLFRYQCSYY